MKGRLVVGLGIAAAVAVASPALGGPSLRDLVRDEVAQQLEASDAKKKKKAKRGPAGPQGPAGPPGATGATGPSSARTVTFAGPVPLTNAGFTTLATINPVDPGAYAVTAKIELLSAGAGGGVNCRLTLGGDNNYAASADTVSNIGTGAGQVSLDTATTSLTQTLNQTSSISIACVELSSGVDAQASTVVLSAIRLGSESHN